MTRDAWSNRTRRVLRRAGWHEERDIAKRVDDWRQYLGGPDGFDMFARAEDVLREFGGLRVIQSGAGKDFARSSFTLDPTLALGEADRFSRFEPELGVRLYPLGEADGGHGFLAIGEDGRAVLFMDVVFLVANTIHEMLNSLIEGQHPAP